jgi:succinate dehydrogenase / fumarate reductase cytochrome b subunit
MSWFAKMFTSSLGKKYVMALTGLFLCTFLVIHLSGNLLTLLPDGGLSFNAFTHFMEHMIVIKILEYVLLPVLSFILSNHW